MKSKRQMQDWRHMLAVCSVMVAVSGGSAYIFLHVNLIPNPASVERALVDDFIQVLLAIAGVFFGVVMTALAYALVFFRRQPGDDTDARPIMGNPPLEAAWTIIPLAIVVALGIYGAIVLDDITAPHPEYTTVQSVYSLGATVPRNIPPSGTAQEGLVVNVTASRFFFEFEYPEYGIKSYVLQVPVDRRILFNISSKDIIHSFWVQPWGPKQDAVPGLSPVLRITPTEIGQYLVQCTQLCGFGHTDMTAPVRVVSAADFEKWVEQQQSSPSPAAPPTGHPAMIDLVAQNIAFDKSTITVPAGAQVTLEFHNMDRNVPHNFAVYTDSSATESIFVGQIVTGPKTITYSFTAPTTPGRYFFRCDPHPSIMRGTFVVE